MVYTLFKLQNYNFLAFFFVSCINLHILDDKKNIQFIHEHVFNNRIMSYAKYMSERIIMYSYDNYDDTEMNFYERIDEWAKETDNCFSSHMAPYV